MMRAALIAAFLLQTEVAATVRDARALTVVVEGVQASEGHIRVDVCTSEQFLGDHCVASGEAPATKGTTLVTVADVGPGVYAVQAFHDRNDNRRVDRGLLGVPTEDVGFSGGAKIGLHGPAFVAASFTRSLEPQAVTVRLKHFW